MHATGSEAARTRPETARVTDHYNEPETQRERNGEGATNAERSREGNAGRRSETHDSKTNWEKPDNSDRARPGGTQRAHGGGGTKRKQERTHRTEEGGRGVGAPLHDRRGRSARTACACVRPSPVTCLLPGSVGNVWVWWGKGASLLDSTKGETRCQIRSHL